MKQVILAYLVTCWAIDLSKPFGIRFPSQVQLLNDLRTNKNERQLEATGTWENLKIHFEYVIEPSADILEQTNTILEIVKTFFGRHLMIKRFSSTLNWETTYETDWEIIQIPTNLQKSYEADVVFFVSEEYDTTVEYVARAAPMFYDKNTGRPIFCLMVMNGYYIQQFQGTDAKFEAALQVVIHESIHGLGFTDNLYPNYIDSETGAKYNQTIYKRINNQIDLPTPRLKQLVENYFGCSNLIGATMEDQGGDGTVGAHFERSIFQNDIMTGTMISGNTLFTEFTFTILEDTGFYRATSHKADIQIWGRDKGCDFYEDQCFSDESYQEFCTNPYDDNDPTDSPLNHLSCSYAHTGISVCVNDGFVECPYYYVYPEFDCRDAANYNEYKYFGLNFYFGYDSMCVKGSLTNNQARNILEHSCFKYSCDSDNKLTIIVDGVSYDCSEGDSQPEYDTTKYSNGFTCPSNPEELCEQVSECPNQCNKKGYCLGGSCTCLQGYSGRACDQTCATYRNGEECVTTCPDQTFPDEYTKYCIGCPANCISCTAKDVCTECADQYMLVGNFCDPDYSIMMTTLLLIGLFLQ